MTITAALCYTSKSPFIILDEMTLNLLTLNVWIELTLKHKHLLFGLFYRPSNSDSAYFSSIEDSVHLAIDTGIQGIIVTGDFNYNMLSGQLSANIEDLCENFFRTQTTKQPTHYTEHFSSKLDIILTTNDSYLILSGVGDLF